MISEYIVVGMLPDIHREGICAIIRNHQPNCKIQTVINNNEIIELYDKHPYAVCILSASAPESEICSLVEKLSKINHYKKTILMVPAKNSNMIEKALRIGVNGLFTQQCTSEEFLKILNEVSSGKNSYSRAVSDIIVENYRGKQLQRSSGKKITQRESEVLSLIVKGLTSAEIAKRLFISPRTVETHRCNLMAKLKLKNTAALVRYALQEEV